MAVNPKWRDNWEKAHVKHDGQNLTYLLEVLRGINLIQRTKLSV